MFSGSEKDYTNTTVNERAQDCKLEAEKWKISKGDREQRRMITHIFGEERTYNWEKSTSTCVTCTFKFWQALICVMKTSLYLNNIRFSNISSFWETTFLITTGHYREKDLLNLRRYREEPSVAFQVWNLMLSGKIKWLKISHALVCLNTAWRTFNSCSYEYKYSSLFF